MTPNLERKLLVGCMIDLACVAIQRNQTNEAFDLLKGLQILRPKLLELDLLNGWVAIKQGRPEEAIKALRSLEASPTHWSIGKALIAICQRGCQDPTWRESANAVLAGDATPDAVEIATKLLANADSVPSDFAVDVQDPELSSAALSYEPSFDSTYFMRA